MVGKAEENVRVFNAMTMWNTLYYLSQITKSKNIIPKLKFITAANLMIIKVP